MEFDDDDLSRAFQIFDTKEEDSSLLLNKSITVLGVRLVMMMMMVTLPKIKKILSSRPIISFRIKTNGQKRFLTSF